MANGEGWHNYHHTFPWDYKAAELGDYYGNLTTGVIDLFAKLGWAYELKTVSKEMIEKRAKRTGDGTHPSSQQAAINNDETSVPCSSFPSKIEDCDNHVWGWDDPDMIDDDKKLVNITHSVGNKVE